MRLHVEVAGDLVDGGERLQPRRVHRRVARAEGEVLVDLLRGAFICQVKRISALF